MLLLAALPDFGVCRVCADADDEATKLAASREAMATARGDMNVLGGALEVGGWVGVQMDGWVGVCFVLF
jgi:hypothetical protein